MQGAFIDALVQPVFKSLSELLPLVHTKCIVPLQSNRAFWNSMQNQDIITTANVLEYLKGIRDPIKEGASSSGEGSATESATYLDVKVAAIPGIPANATKTYNSNTRNLSMIAMKYSAVNDDDLELGDITSSCDEDQNQTTPKTRKVIMYKNLEISLRRYLESNVSQTFLLSATIYALFASDINLTIGSKSRDDVVNAFAFIVLMIFVIEILVSIICVPKYSHFFLWLDLAASVSLLFEIDLLFGFGDSPGDLSLAKASRVAKVGARAGRLVIDF